MVHRCGIMKQDVSQWGGVDLSLKLICPDCKEDPPNLATEYSDGDMVCGDCGLVLGDRIVDTRSEWRTFANDDQGNDDPSRTGDAENDLLTGSQLKTHIMYNDSMKGNKAATSLLRAANKQSTDKADRYLMSAYREISVYADALNVPKVASDAAKYYLKTVYDLKGIKGKTTSSIIASCLFLACRQLHIPRTFREVYAATNVTKKEIGKTHKLISNLLRNAGAIDDAPEQGNVEKSTSATDLCTRFCNQLGLNEQKFIKVSTGLAEKMSTVGDLAGRSPLSVAAACIYMASHLLGKPKNAKEIGAVCGVSDGTIRTAYKFLYQERVKLIDPTWIANGKGNMANLPGL